MANKPYRSDQAVADAQAGLDKSVKAGQDVVANC